VIGTIVGFGVGGNGCGGGVGNGCGGNIVGCGGGVGIFGVGVLTGVVVFPCPEA
jgi:hypothetical protein